MDKEKQIEEMAKEIEKSYTAYKGFCPRKLTVCGFIKNCMYCNIATHLIEQGYRKIDENEVVISKEDLKKLSSSIKSEQEVRQIEIFNDIVIALTERHESAKYFYGIKESVGVDMSIRIVKFFAEKYGVDLGETK